DVWVIDDPDIDVGCLPGGLVWLSEGLLALARDRGEVLGALVFASRLCPAASQLWREREHSRLVDDRENHWLFQRYRDYRLPSNAPLYNLMVTAACDRGCAAGLDQDMQAVDGDPDAWRRLLARVQALSPDAALLLRLNRDQVPLVEPEGGASAPSDWLQPFHQRRDALLELAQSRRKLWADSLHEAYRAGLRARRQLPDSLRLQLHQAELDLANRHSEYAQRILENLQRDGYEIPNAGYWWGWVHLNLRRREQAASQLEQSLEQLARVSAHYRMGEALFRLHRRDEARMHYNTVLQAGPLHPEHIRAQARLDSMED
ncbi:MAG: tetratricopeptide repeat protein, partial [Wenzhouxiangellaceae bacterium]